MSFTGIDPARLFQILQTTGLQNKDSQLYQLLFNLIQIITSLRADVTSGGGGGGSSSTIVHQLIQQLALSDNDGGPGEIGPPGIPGVAGVNGMVPYYIAPTETFTVPIYKQALFSMNIDNEGILVVDGFLIEVDDSNDPDVIRLQVLIEDGINGEDSIIPGPAGAIGITGPQGAIGPPGLNGEDATDTDLMGFSLPPDLAYQSRNNAFIGANSFATNLVDLLVGQLKFPATQNPSANANTLDDYEEGTWTPVLVGTTSQSGQVYSLQSGKYIKIGKIVVFNFQVTLSTLGTFTGSVQISGLPFTVEGSVYATCGWTAMTTAYVNMAIFPLDATVLMFPLGITAANVSSTLGTIAQANLSATSSFVGSGVYIATA